MIAETSCTSPPFVLVDSPIVLDRTRLQSSKSTTERNRKFISRMYCLAATGVIIATKSFWQGASFVDESLFILGIMLAAAGCLGRIWCNLFVVGYKNRKLITVGPYSICRNPLYFFSAVGLLGIGMTTCTITMPILLLVSFALYYPRIIRSEQRRMSAMHGQAFAEYCRVTPAFFPRWSQLREPATYLVHAKAFRKNLSDAIWFLWLVGFIHTIGHLHTAGSLPTLLVIR